MNFKEFDNLIHNGVNEIVLDSDIVRDDSEHSDYYFGIKLDSDNLVIDGQGHMIDARKDHIFKVSARNITLKNISFKRAKIEIVKGANLTIHDCSFDSNAHEKITVGGMIRNGGEVKISNSAFRNADLHFDDTIGGAIYNCGNLSVENSIFESNSAHSSGGAIHNDKTMKIIGCVFNSNKSYSGGAIFNSGELIINDSAFKGNSGDGGAIWNEGIYKSENCTFKDNMPDDVH